jgi:hypothetical protein
MGQPANSWLKISVLSITIRMKPKRLILNPNYINQVFATASNKVDVIE